MTLGVNPWDIYHNGAWYNRDGSGGPLPIGDYDSHADEHAAMEKLKAGGSFAFDFADVSIGTPTANWTVEKSSAVTFGGKQTLKVSATAGASDTLVCVLTVPSSYLGGAKRLAFSVKPEDTAKVGTPSLLVQMWVKYDSGTTTHRLSSYAYASHGVGDWAEGVCFDADAAGSGHISGTPVWASVGAQDFTEISLVVSKSAGQAVSNLYISPIYTDPIIDTRPIVTLFFDGVYSGQWKYAKQLLSAYGLRASFAILPYWFGNSGNMTEAQVLALYGMGHELIHHTGAAGPTGHVDVGWDDTSKYPDGQEYDLVKADVEITQNWMRTKGATRGLGYGVVGFTNGLTTSQTLTRRTNITNALRAAGMKKIRQLAAYNSSYYGAAQESSLLVTPSSMVTSAVATATTTGQMDSIKNRGGWSGFTYHDIKISGASGNDRNVADLETEIAYLAGLVAAGTVRVLPFGEAMQEIGRIPAPV